MRNVIGPRKRDSLPMFIRERAATAVERMTDDQRRLSICLASLEKGWFSMIRVIVNVFVLVLVDFRFF